jgi:hypothetical protein
MTKHFGSHYYVDMGEKGMIYIDAALGRRNNSGVWAKLSGFLEMHKGVL